MFDVSLKRCAWTMVERSGKDTELTEKKKKTSDMSYVYIGRW